MKTAKPKPHKPGGPDDFQTPPDALRLLLPYIDKSWTIWECACGQGYLTTALQEKGYNVIGTDILTGHDFLKWEPIEHWDCIITNPPYSLKQQFIERCYELGRRFALLIPVTTFESIKRQRLFERYGLQVIFLPKRIGFMTPQGEQKKQCWFATAWFTNSLNLPKDMVFNTAESME